MIHAGQERRRAEIAANLDLVRGRIADACLAAARSPDEVTLIVVTKTFPASDVRLLAELGVLDVAENRDQEAGPKAATCAGLGLRWHFVGQLQTNKVKSVARYAHAVHSVDRPRLVEALSRAVQGRERELSCLVQVSLDAAPGRGGIPRGAAADLARQVAAAPGLRLRGVMAVAPLGGDPDAAFSLLATVAAGVREAVPDADWISAGMSGDLEAAIAHGATHVRVGSAILGPRPTTG